MAAKRKRIPKIVSDAVMKEYHHRCAMCGRHGPHLHHLDQNPSNNDLYNLIPLCPNCHLQDVHDPTSPPNTKKLRLFRVYKDPLILDPRFHPIFERMAFLYDHSTRANSPRLWSYWANEFLRFIKELSMGDFYAKKIHEILKFSFGLYVIELREVRPDITKETISADPKLREDAIQHSLVLVEKLTVELLRYQGWNVKKVTPETESFSGT